MKMKPIPHYDCEMCDGEDGPAVVRVRIRDWDNSLFTARVCTQCRKDNAEEIVKVLKRL